MPPCGGVGGCPVMCYVGSLAREESACLWRAEEDGVGSEAGPAAYSFWLAAL
jgi:hypothetical protein